MNLVALSLFVTSLLAFAAFHFTDWSEEEPSPGYQAWPEILEMLQTADFTEPRASIGLVMFPCFALLALSSPFLIGILRRSRLAWWLLVLFSGCCLIAIGAFIVTNTQSAPDEPDQRGAGFFFLAGALLSNFLGMLFVRRDGTAVPLGNADASQAPTDIGR